MRTPASKLLLWLGSAAVFVLLYAGLTFIAYSCAGMQGGDSSHCGGLPWESVLKVLSFPFRMLGIR